MPTLLVFRVIPRLPINPKELKTQIERIKAIKLAQDEMTGIIAADLIKMALTKRVSAVSDDKLIEGCKVLMYRERPVAECVGPYLIFKREEKMSTLGTGDLYIEASIDKLKRYYSFKPDDAPEAPEV